MKSFFIAIAFFIFISPGVSGQVCTPLGDEVTSGTNDTWIGYVYDNIDFTTYMGYVNEGAPGNPAFDESFGGNAVNYTTNGCPVLTESFSVRYKLTKNFAPGNYLITVGGDDGYRLSIDGGATWVINNWTDHAYATSTYGAAFSGTYDLVLEYYDNAGTNRVSFNVQTSCVGSEDESIYGTGNIWNGYIYDGTSFNIYSGLVTEGSFGNPDFDENFGGSNVTYNTSSCGVETQSFSARYRLRKTFLNDNYTFLVGGDDGYRLSLDGGATWVINRWFNQPYTIFSYAATLNGTYDMVLEYYENGGGNRISISINGTVLPVKLIAFDGKASGKSVNLNWTVNSEINTDYYLVERSPDGINFLSNGKVYANRQGATVVDKNYGYTDISPFGGNNYYRLRMVDKDEKYTYSPIIRVQFNEKNSVTIFPTLNTRGNIYLRTSSNLKNTSIELYDITGRMLQVIKLPSITAGQTIPLPLQTGKFTKGTYILLCKSNGSIITKQVIVNE